MSILISNINKSKTILITIAVLLFFVKKTTAQIGFLSKDKYPLPANLSLANQNFINTSASFKASQIRFLPSTIEEYNPKRDPKRLLINTGIYAATTLISFTTLWLMPESVTNWDKDQIKEEGLGKKWRQNVDAGPVWDEDDWVLNYVMHPWFGGVYYMSARGSGFKAWESFTYSAIMSTFFWEYGIEAFAEIPSKQDLIVTPVIGSIVGEGFFMAKKSIIRNDKRILGSRALGRFTIFLMDPFNAITNGLGYKTKNKVSATSAFVPVGFDQNSKKTVWGMQIAVNF